ncbi:4Fe-4S dicluster domain-containing protein [Candidatus Poribacteria bacterium]|nr:4Fe-4S dicluster domain-containing protein [Candidatus Poribacteria bacterium]
MKRIRTLNELESLGKSIRDERAPRKTRIVISTKSACCYLKGSQEVTDAFKNELNSKTLGNNVDIMTTGCLGFCEIEPIVVIYPQGIFYQRVGVDNVPAIMSRTIIAGEIIDELLYTEPTTGEKVVYEKDIPFYNQQLRLILGNNSNIDPTSITDYFAIGGYGAFSEVLSQMAPEQVIEEIKKSGLRGRGGGGFPTGLKWELCRKAKARDGIKYVICNADEGDPGAYMDRSILEGNPHSVLEGMLIGAYAIGSSEGYIYVRNEYPIAVENVSMAIAQMEEYGLLGQNILGSDFSFNVTINRGGGAFVCGESTALMASLEGKPGEPRPKYIHTVEEGLWNRPTNLNNVETWANVPLIISKGAEWYSNIGTAKSKGTKVFSLVGKINNTGLVEVPMGTSFEQIIYNIGGGIPEDKKLKAVQIGGPSGGCIPEKLMGLPIDFDELSQIGTMMGSGGMIVMDEDNCMVDIARYFIQFLEGESCGKCVPCREGLERMDEILTDICEGCGTTDQLELLEELAFVVKDASLCALGSTAPNPVLSTLRYFRDEYEAHIKDKKCPAGVCRALIQYSIDSAECTGCGACVKACPENAITGAKKEPRMINQELCIKCGACYDVCKFDAITKK